MTNDRLQRMALRRLGYYYDGFEVPSEFVMPGVPAWDRVMTLLELQDLGYVQQVSYEGDDSCDWIITLQGLCAYEHLCSTGELVTRRELEECQTTAKNSLSKELSLSEALPSLEREMKSTLALLSTAEDLLTRAITS